jgi:hypothetical protein
LLVDYMTDPLVLELALELLDDETLSEDELASVLNLLGEASIGNCDSRAAERIEPFLRHPSDSVRGTALMKLTRIPGARARSLADREIARCKEQGYDTLASSLSTLLARNEPDKGRYCGEGEEPANGDAPP